MGKVFYSEATSLDVPTFLSLKISTSQTPLLPWDIFWYNFAWSNSIIYFNFLHSIWGSPILYGNDQYRISDVCTRHCIASEEMRSIKMSFHHLTALEGMHLVYFCKGNSQSILAFTFKPLELEGSWEQKGDSVSHSTAESGRKWDKQCKSGRKRSKSVPTAENRTFCMQVL